MFGSAYISRQLDIHPCHVAGAAAEWHHSLCAVRWRRRSVRVCDNVWLAAEARGSKDPLQLYGVHGVLWVCCVPVSLNLEFSMWSETKSEVGIRPDSMSWPVGSTSYVDRVAATLDNVNLGLCVLTRKVDNTYSPLGLTDQWRLPEHIALSRRMGWKPNQ